MAPEIAEQFMAAQKPLTIEQTGLVAHSVEVERNEQRTEQVLLVHMQNIEDPQRMASNLVQSGMQYLIGEE